MFFQQTVVFDRLLFRKEGLDLAKGILLIRGGRHHLDPVAGREKHSLFDRRERMQRLQRVSKLRAVERNLLTHLDRSGAVVEAYDDDFPIHDLLKPATVPARKNRVAPKKITQHDD